MFTSEQLVTDSNPSVCDKSEINVFAVFNAVLMQLYLSLLKERIALKINFYFQRFKATLIYYIYIVYLIPIDSSIQLHTDTHIKIFNFAQSQRTIIV